MEFPRSAPGAASHPYTFGDTEIAARRLALVARVYGPSSRALLAAAVTSPPDLAYDLGCGPGHTTTLVSRQTGAGRTIGLDSSAAHIARAAANAPAGIEFAVHDILDLPFPGGPADLIYGRLLLAHLADPVAAARAWAAQLTADGLLVIDEIEWITSTQPVLRTHLRIAEALVATTGARMCAGPLLAALPAVTTLSPILARITEVPVPTALAATMFGMNVTAWGQRPVTLGLCREGELGALATGLAELTQSAATGEITWGMHQAAYGRSG